MQLDSCLMVLLLFQTALVSYMKEQNNLIMVLIPYIILRKLYQAE